jgi:hypothetical protein
MLLPTKGLNATAARKQPKKGDLQVGMTYLWLDMADHILNFLARVLGNMCSANNPNNADATRCRGLTL